MPVTLKDVAKAARVNESTASRALYGYADISAETKKRVAAAAARLGYTPNLRAQSLATKKSFALGLVIPEPHFLYGRYLTDMLAGIEIAAARHGLAVTLLSGETMQTLSTRGRIFERIDAAIVVTEGRMDKEMRLLNESKLPAVYVGRPGPARNGCLILSDDEGGAEAAVQHLIGLGHRRIAFLGGAAGGAASERRLAGYQRALRAAGIRPDSRLIRYGSFAYGFAHGQKLVCELLDECLDFTAVFAASDQIACGVIRALNRRGLKVPQDVSVVGFDDETYAELLVPALTSVFQDGTRTGTEAVSLVLDKEHEPGLRRIIPTTLVVRESTAAPRK